MELTTALRIAVLGAAVGATPAFAAHDKTLEHEQQVLEGAKTSLSQAISTAESDAGGKAVSARLARYHTQDVYDVHVLKGSELVDVRIAVDDGKVLSTRPMEHGHMAKTKATHEKTEPSGSKRLSARPSLEATAPPSR